MNLKVEKPPRAAQDQAVGCADMNLKPTKTSSSIAHRRALRSGWRRVRRRMRIWALRRGLVAGRAVLLLSFAIVALAALGLVTWQGVVLVNVATSDNENALTATQSLVATGGAIIALMLAAWRTLTAKQQADTSNRQAATALRQAETAEYGQRTSRYATGVNMLTNELLMVRIGGVDVLAGLAREDPKRFGRPICDTLAAFVRHPPHNRDDQLVVQSLSSTEDAAGSKTDASTYRLRPDVNAAVLTLGTLSSELRRVRGLHSDYRVDLSKADLRGLDARFAELPMMEFTDARLDNADLHSACLRDCWFFGTGLCNANLQAADLNGSRIVSANADGAKLSYANLANAAIAMHVHLPSASCLHVSACVIDGPAAELNSKVLRNAWAWRDQPPRPLGGSDQGKLQIELYDEALRPGWEVVSGPSLGYGPPKTRI